MKKKLLALIPLAGIMIAALTGCQAGLVNTDLTMYSDGSGTKTIAVEVLGTIPLSPGRRTTRAPRRSATTPNSCSSAATNSPRRSNRTPRSKTSK